MNLSFVPVLIADVWSENLPAERRLLEEWVVLKPIKDGV